MAITMTESAAKHIQKQVEKSGNGIGLRLGVKKVRMQRFCLHLRDCAIGAGDRKGI